MSGFLEKAIELSHYLWLAPSGGEFSKGEFCVKQKRTRGAGFSLLK